VKEQIFDVTILEMVIWNKKNIKFIWVSIYKISNIEKKERKFT